MKNIEIKPMEQRRYITRTYRNAETLIKTLFSIPDDELIFDVSFSRMFSELELKTLKNCDEKQGDVFLKKLVQNDKKQ